MSKLQKPFKDEFVFTEEEKHILIISLEHMRQEIEKFQDKQCEYGDMTISTVDIEALKEYLRYG